MGWGIGFVFTANDPYAVLDLDHVRDQQTGETEPWALAILDEVFSYSELSKSCTGWHIIVRGCLPGFGNKAGRVEIYDRAKVMRLTGNTQPFIGDEEIRTVDLSSLQARIGTLDPDWHPQQRPVISGPTRKQATGNSESEEDYRLIGQIRRRLRTQDAAKIESEFQRKYPGRYNSQNQKHGAHCGRNYIRYSIERQLSGR
ncbi:MAG TPA: hypothetical protein VFA85_15765 [Terriglobales bacterium]|nr:hypothetical protein [Terriglobales bacterium]